MNKKPKVAFVCVHNSCRSQMAEALAKEYAFDVFEAYSGGFKTGTETKSNINPDAVEVLKDLYNIDMTKTQYPKLINNLPDVDIVIKMGCNVSCPFLPSKHEEDWGLDDPSGKNKEEFIKTAEEMENKIKNLALRIKNKEINV